MIDRPKRTEMIETIRAYLHCEIKAFEFDDRMWKLGRGSDKTVCYVQQQCWYFYSDTRDHWVNFNRDAWNYIQRLLLLLTANAEIEIESARNWGPKQRIAALVFVFSVAGGVGLWTISPWLITPILVGLAVYGWRLRADTKALDLAHSENCYRIIPFADFSELRQVRVATPHFFKETYPSELVEQYKLSQRLESLVTKLFAWLGEMLLPLEVFLGALPRKVETMRVKLIDENDAQ